MLRTTIVQNKILTIICSIFFFCLVNIYRPSLGKVWLGRPNPKPLQPINFYPRRKKKYNSTQNCMHNKSMMPNFQFWFSFIFKKYLKISKKTVKSINYIYNNYSLVFFFWKSGIIPLLWSFYWCQHNLFHLVAMDNECLKRFWNFKNSTFEKCI